MSIYSNSYIKENKKIKLRLDEVVGNNLIRLTIQDKTKMYSDIIIYIEKTTGILLSKLLYTKTQGEDIEGMELFIKNEIESFEYIDPYFKIKEV